MKVLIACEFSGTVRRAFLDKGHNAWSCDLLPADDKSKYHYKCDIGEILDEAWDMMIAFPPCTHLCSSGARWFKDKQAEQKEAIGFFMILADFAALFRSALIAWPVLLLAFSSKT